MSGISIITVTRNAAVTLPDCLISIARQDIAAEHIIIDGASTDNTMAILNDHLGQIAKIISEQDQGIYDAMNKGIQLASGEVIGMLNADDYYPAHDVLSKVSGVFDDPAVEACYGDLVYVDKNDRNRQVRYWRAGDYNPKKFYRGWMPPHPTFFVRRNVYERYGRFKPELGTAADYEIMLRFLLKHQIKTVYIPEVLVHMRTGGASNVTLINRIRANRMDRKAWEVNGIRPRPWTLYAKPIRKLGQWIIKKH